MAEALVTIRELRQKRARLWEQAKALHDAAKAEDRDLSAEEREQWDKINTEVDALKARIDREERADALDREMVERQADAQPVAEDDEIERTEPVRVTAMPEYRRAYNTYLRGGMGELSGEERALLRKGHVSMSNAEQRALGVGAGPTGGFTVPDEDMAPVISARARYGGVRAARITVRTTESGADFPVPLNNDTGNLGARIGENNPVGELDTSFGQKILRAYMYTSRMIRVPYQFIQDTSIEDFESWLFGLMGQRIGRITNQEFTTGLGGGNEPEGILTGSVLGHTTVAAAVVDHNDLVQQVHSVDPEYRFGAQWMFHDLSLAVLKGMEDGFGRPLWVPGVALGEPDTLAGYGYVINQDMPQPVAGAFVTATTPILFGDMNYYWVRDVRGFTVLRLEERYAENLQVAFLGYSRHDGALLDAGTHPIRHMLIS